MNTLLSPGETTYRDFGPLHIRIDRHDEGVAINVRDHDTLNRQFTNLDEGRKYLTNLRDMANAGLPLWQIEAAAGALTSAAAVYDDTERELITSLNADFAQAEADTAKLVEERKAQAEAATANPAESWAAFRQGVSRTAAPRTPTMQQLLDNAVNGYIPRGGQPGQANTRQLIGLSHRGDVTLHYRKVGNRREIAGAWTTSVGAAA